MHTERCEECLEIRWFLWNTLMIWLEGVVRGAGYAVPILAILWYFDKI